jgi:hypothetical protein
MATRAAVSFVCKALCATARFSSTVAPHFCELVGGVVCARDDGGATSSADAIRIRSDNERLRKLDNFPRKKADQSFVLW